MRSLRAASGPLAFGVLATAACDTALVDVMVTVDGGAALAGPRTPQDEAIDGGVGGGPDGGTPVTPGIDGAAPLSPAPDVTCEPIGAACTSAESCCTRFCVAWGPFQMRCSPPPGCFGTSSGPGPGGVTCTRMEFDPCVTTADCCTGACTRSIDGVDRCHTSATCRAGCEVCRNDEECCSGECDRTSGGDLSRCGFDL